MEGSRRPRRWRYLIDIVVLMAVTFFLDALLGAFIRVPINLEKGFVFDAIGKTLLVGLAWGLIRLRGERLADIGLKRPASWTRIFILGIGLAAIVFIAMYLSEKAGFRRDQVSSRMCREMWSSHFLAFCMHLSGRGFMRNSCFADFLCRASPCCSVQAALRGSPHVSYKARFSGQRTLTRILSASRLPAHWAC